MSKVSVYKGVPKNTVYISCILNMDQTLKYLHRYIYKGAIKELLSALWHLALIGRENLEVFTEHQSGPSIGWGDENLG